MRVCGKLPARRGDYQVICFPNVCFLPQAQAHEAELCRWPICHLKRSGHASWAAMFRCTLSLMCEVALCASQQQYKQQHVCRARRELPSQFCKSTDEIVSICQEAAAGASMDACISHTMNVRCSPHYRECGSTRKSPKQTVQLRQWCCADDLLCGASGISAENAEAVA